MVLDIFQGLDAKNNEQVHVVHDLLRLQVMMLLNVCFVLMLKAMEKVIDFLICLGIDIKTMERVLMFLLF